MSADHKKEKEPEYLYYLYIIGKSGSLLYDRDFGKAAKLINSNDALFLASTFHAMHAISASGIAPSCPPMIDPLVNHISCNMSFDEVDVQDALPQKLSLEALPGITNVETEHFQLFCQQTLSGNKFVIVTTPKFAASSVVLKRIAILFSDYALKNPFYELGMPVRCQKFDRELVKFLSSYS